MSENCRKLFRVISKVDLSTLPALDACCIAVKLYNVKIDCEGIELLEKVVEYMKTMHQICHIKIFIFVGLKQYLTKQELEKLYEFVFYEKIILCIMEAEQTERIIGEKGWLLDKDLRIIEL